MGEEAQALALEKLMAENAEMEKEIMRLTKGSTLGDTKASNAGSGPTGGIRVIKFGAPSSMRARASTTALLFAHPSVRGARTWAASTRREQLLMLPLPLLLLLH